MTQFEIKQQIIATPFCELIGAKLSTGCIPFKRENLLLMNQLKNEVPGLRVCELSLKWSRVIDLPENCMNKFA